MLDVLHGLTRDAINAHIEKKLADGASDLVFGALHAALAPLAQEFEEGIGNFGNNMQTLAAQGLELGARNFSVCVCLRIETDLVCVLRVC